ncbi:MAG: ComF family protein [Candidatus Omnitrophica bacterium]|nr:ComF family protein [Candidatus Omnitrophota bacterium]
MLGILINLLYPASCQVCGIKTNRWNENICADCLKNMRKRLPPFCRKCGRQMPGNPGSENICADCRNSAVYFDRALSAFHYDDSLKELVHSFKYNKATCMAKEFSDLITAFMKQHGIDREIDLILPIPMHPARLFKREVNPSDILAKNIARKLSVRYSGAFLKKIKNTRAQSKLSRHERIKNIKGSFFLTRHGAIETRQKNILLVDDLFTTGSTVNECARVLKKAGSGRVNVITLARGDSLP